MRSLLFLILMGFGVVAGANTNGGGVLSVKSGAGQTIVFKTGETGRYVHFAEARANYGRWILESRSIEAQELGSEVDLAEALEESAETGQWSILHE